MSSDLSHLGIDRLSVPERIELVHAIWDSIATEHSTVPLSEVQLNELRRRAAKHDRGEGESIPWEQVRNAALARLKQ